MKDSSKMLNFNLNRTLAFEAERRVDLSPDRELLFSSVRELQFDLDRELGIRGRGVIFRGYVCAGCGTDISRDAVECTGCGAILEQISEGILGFNLNRDLHFDHERRVGFDLNRDLVFNQDRELIFDVDRELNIRMRGVVFRGYVCSKCGAPALPEAKICDECGAEFTKAKEKGDKPKMVWERGKKVTKKKPKKPKKAPRKKAPQTRRKKKGKRGTFYCPVCGKLLYVGSNFCTTCGTMFSAIKYKDGESRDGRPDYKEPEWRPRNDEHEKQRSEAVKEEKESTTISWDEYRRRGRRDGIVSWDEYYKRKKR
jgi:predicted amidophosphoribosyltransferase